MIQEIFFLGSSAQSVGGLRAVSKTPVPSLRQPTGEGKAGGKEQEGG